MLLLLTALAQAVDADALLARVDEIAPLRTHRRTAQAPSFTADDYRRAASGRVVTGLFPVEGHAAKVAWGLAVVDVGIEALWAGINSEQDQLDLLPVTRIELVGGRECESGREVLFVLPVPVITDRWWINRNTYNAPLADASGGAVREFLWESLSDPSSHAMSEAARAEVEGLVPLSFNRGAYFLVALDPGHTLVEYHSWVDPGGRVPAGAASMFATSGIEDTIEAMRTYAKRPVIRCAGRS